MVSIEFGSTDLTHPYTFNPLPTDGKVKAGIGGLVGLQARLTSDDVNIVSATIQAGTLNDATQFSPNKGPVLLELWLSTRGYANGAQVTVTVLATDENGKMAGASANVILVK